jgi:hypothetical protein
MLNYTNFWPAVGLTIGVGLLVTAALCLLVALFSPDWFRPRRRYQTAVAPAGHGGYDHRDHQNHRNHQNHQGHRDRREPEAA